MKPIVQHFQHANMAGDKIVYMSKCNSAITREMLPVISIYNLTKSPVPRDRPLTLSGYREITLKSKSGATRYY